MPIKKEMMRNGSAVKLSVTIPKDELCAAYYKAVDDIGGKVQIPGFRRGKAPRAVLERKFGDALKEDALNSIIGETVKGIIEDKDFPEKDKPLFTSQPELDGDFPKLDITQDLQFNVKWDAAPEVVIKEWQGFTAEVPDVKIAKEEIDAELEVIRERNSIVIDRAANDAAQKGDVVTVDYVELNDGGTEIASTRRDGFVFTIGNNTNVYDIDNDITGMKSGEVKIVNNKIKITLKSVKEKKLPALDDDLAQDVDEKFEKLDDLKADIRKKLEIRLDETLFERKTIAVFDKIIEANPVDVPNSMIEYELFARMLQFGRQYGMGRDELSKEMAKEDGYFKKLADDMRPNVKKQLHRELLQQKLLEEQKFSVSDDDREAEYAKLAENSRQTIEEVKKYYEESERKYSLDDYLKSRKLFELLLQKNTVTKGAAVSYKEFINGPAGGAA